MFNLRRISTILAASTLLILLAYSCDKDPIRPPSPDETIAPSSNRWKAVTAGSSNDLTTEEGLNRAAQMITGYIKALCEPDLTESDPNYHEIQSMVHDCFKMLSTLRINFLDDGRVNLDPMPGITGKPTGNVKKEGAQYAIHLDKMQYEANATTYQRYFAEQYSDTTFILKEDGQHLLLQISGKFVCRPIAKFAREKNLPYHEKLYNFGENFAGFPVKFVPDESEQENHPAEEEEKKEILPLSSWKVIKVGSNPITTDSELAEAAKKPLGPINLLYTKLDKNSQEFADLSREVELCYRLFRQLAPVVSTRTSTENGEEHIDTIFRISGIEGIDGAITGRWQQVKNGIQMTFGPITAKPAANRFEKQFAADYANQTKTLEFEKNSNSLLWKIDGPFVIVPIANYANEKGLAGYKGMMSFSKIFQGFKLTLIPKK